MRFEKRARRLPAIGAKQIFFGNPICGAGI
jgi:hypothetical protein